jgi:mannose-1-phosphate guanylyltransferase/mannose-6-phosphate isomerase
VPQPIIVPVVLSGGSGTRLWPLSRPLTPKQLLALVTHRTLLQDTVLRVRALAGTVTTPLVICNQAHRFAVAEQLEEIAAGVGPASGMAGVGSAAVPARGRIVLEPAGRNTAPAVAVAALLALRDAGDRQGAGSEPTAGGDDDPILLVMPADHVILDTDAFAAAVAVAVQAAAGGRLVTFGVMPTRPETGYGYIRRGAAQAGGWHRLERFVEKPDAATAKKYLLSGEYLWNSGMFLFSARAYLDELARYAPAMVEACTAAVDGAVQESDFLRLGSAFHESPSDSIDYAVMEKTDRAAVVPLDAGWSDIGSWPALHEVLEKDGDGNVLRGTVVAEGCRDSYVLASGRLVVTLGLDEHVVVETEDAVLVMAHGHAQRLKNVVEGLEVSGRTPNSGEMGS